VNTNRNIYQLRLKSDPTHRCQTPQSITASIGLSLRYTPVRCTKRPKGEALLDIQTGPTADLGPSSGAPPHKSSRPLQVRVRSALFLLPAWFSPSSALRSAFHRLRGARIAKSAEIGYFVIIDNLYPEKVQIEDYDP